MSAPTFYCLGDDVQITSMFQDWGWEKSKAMPTADLVVFTGGEDVTPFLYGEERHPYTHSNWKRDLREISAFKALSDDKPKVGICRGGQFLNVMCGGKLWQHVDGHATGHMHIMREVGGKERSIRVTSTHHQMMLPKGNYKLIGVASEASRKESATRKVDFVPDNDGVRPTHTWLDIEAVYYPNHNALCYQPHPEYSQINDNDENEAFFMEQVENLLLTKEMVKALNKARESK